MLLLLLLLHHHVAAVDEGAGTINCYWAALSISCRLL